MSHKEHALDGTSEKPEAATVAEFQIAQKERGAARPKPPKPSDREALARWLDEVNFAEFQHICNT